MTTVSARPRPATSSGFSQHACRMRSSALRRSARQAFTGAEPRERLCQHRQRHRPVGHRAAVRAADLRAKLGTRYLFEHAMDALLNVMVRLPVVDGRLAEVHGGRKHAGMLARAVVVKLRRRLAGGDECVRGRGAERSVRSAVQGRGRETRAMQHRGSQGRVPLGAGVRAARERDLGGTEAEVVGGATFDQRHGLQRLNRRARIDGRCDVAQRQRERARRCSDRDRAAVPALDQLAARHFDENGICHDLARKELSAQPVSGRRGPRSSRIWRKCAISS